MTPTEYKKFLITELQKIKNDEHRIKKNSYMRGYNKIPKQIEWKTNYNKEYWEKYKQTEAYKERAKLRAHNKWLEHRQKINNNKSTERKKPNYNNGESYCARCEIVFPKALNCPECHKRARWGKRRKKEVFRY